MSELPSGPADGYALGRSEAETRRLIVQHQLYGPFTRQFLTAAGVTSGMKVVDVGSGAGDVALLVAELVGPQGRVVGWTTPPPGAPGPDPEMGLKLFSTFLRAGLPAPQLRRDVPMGGGPGWPGYA